MSRRSVALLACVAACSTEAPAGRPVVLAVRVEVPAALRAEIAARALTVSGGGASCAGADVSGGAPLDGLRDVPLRPGEPATLQVSPGPRAFFVLAADASGAPVARACAQETLEPGGTYTITLTLVAYCMDGAVESCAATCGTAGTRTCAGDRTWGPCVPPAESCNGRDDDCDGECDDGFGCCAGAGAACTPAGGGAGVQTCDAGCNLVGACVPMGLCSVDGFCWLHPMPQGHALHAVWAAAPGDAWAVGERGTILHWDGTAWAAEAGGTLADLHGVWGSSPDDVWAVGDGGTILRRQGGAWAAVPTPGIGATLHAVWGAGPMDVWTVGAGGVILHWRPATGWSREDAMTSLDLFAVSGSSATLVWAVGDAGVIRRFNGSIWQTRATRGPGALYAVHTDGASDIWVGGADGDIDYYEDGFGWTMEANRTSAVRALGGSFSRPYATLDDGSVLRRTTAASWLTDFSFPVPGTALRGIGGTAGDGDVWVVGDGGAVAHYDGGWSPSSHFTGSDLADAWGWTAGDVWGAGAEGIRLNWTGAGWQARPPGAAVHALCGSSAANAWGAGWQTAGAAGEVRHVLRRSGPSWDYVMAPVTPPVALPLEMNGIWTSSPADTWVVGPGGLILRWNGAGYESQASPTTNDLAAAWGAAPDDVWAVGAAGTIVRWDGNRWDTAPSAPTTRDLEDVWGSDASHVWAVGAAGTVIFFDGTAWADRSIAAAMDQDLRAVWGPGGDDVWVVGTAGAIYQREGGAWVAKASGVVRDLEGVWGFGLGDVWVVGQGATVLRRVP